MKPIKFLTLAVMVMMLAAVPLSACQYDADDSDICGPSLVQATPSVNTADGFGLGTAGSGTILKAGNSECPISEREGSVVISMEGSPEIGSLGFTVTFNQNYFTVTDAVSSDLLTMSSCDISDNTCTLGFTSKTAGVSETSTGSIVTIYYECEDDAACGTYPVLVDKQYSSNGAGSTVPVQVLSGTVLVTGMPGDINGDGEVSMADSLLMQRIMSGQERRSVGSTDLDNDGDTDTADAILLKKYMAGWDVEPEASYALGSNSISVFGHMVNGVGYGAIYIDSDRAFAVMKNGTASSFSHDQGDTYCTDLRSGVELVVKDGSSKESTERTITYEMNGGNFDSSMPFAYTPGGKTDLGCPTNDDPEQMFMGWYTDSECTELMLYIPSASNTDLHLYALWGDTVIGHGYSMNYHTDVTDSGDVANLSYSVNGTYETTYWAYDPTKGTLIRNYTTIDVVGGGSTSSEKVGWHKSGSGSTVTDGGIVEIDIDGWTVSAHKMTSVSKDGTVTETQYFIYGWLPVKIETESTASKNQFTATHVLSDILSFEVQDTYSVTVYTGYGINISGSAEADVGCAVTLTANAKSGSTFGGWYNLEGNLVSTSKTISLENIISDTTLIAKNNESYDVFCHGNESLEMTSSDSQASWTMIDMSTLEIVKQSTGSTFQFENQGAGFYELLVSGTYEGSGQFHEAWFILMDECITKTYSWKAPNILWTQTVTLDISYSDFIAYRNSGIDRAPGIFDPNVEYVTYTDPAVVDLADWMTEKTKNMSTYNALNYVLSFVQLAIPYAYDSVSMGTDEYWKYPVETLVDGCGDCEDTSILYCAITKAMGYDTALMTFYGHAVAGINIEELGYSSDDVEKVRYYGGVNMYCWYLKEGGERTTFVYPSTDGTSKYYFYCETTAGGWTVGKSVGYQYLENPGDTHYSSLNVIRVVRVV